MNTIEINLRDNFKKTSYVFGYSKTSNIQDVSNWQDGNNSFNIQNDGVYYFFARHKRSGKISVYQKTVNCAGVVVPCSISYLKPYQKIISNSCQISYLNPYIANNTITEQYETDWIDGTTSGSNCNISFLYPYLVVTNTQDVYETDWTDGNSTGINCQISFLTAYFN
jgi:hypothetical protein